MGTDPVQDTLMRCAVTIRVPSGINCIHAPRFGRSLCQFTVVMHVSASGMLHAEISV
jgi:hypothetical protein